MNADRMGQFDTLGNFNNVSVLKCHSSIIAVGDSGRFHPYPNTGLQPGDPVNKGQQSSNTYRCEDPKANGKIFVEVEQLAGYHRPDSHGHCRLNQYDLEGKGVCGEGVTEEKAR
jgi:hypothetical protein